MTERRVAVTGIGLVCSLGLDRESVWQALCEGRCGIADLTLFEGDLYRSRMVAQVRVARCRQELEAPRADAGGQLDAAKG